MDRNIDISIWSFKLLRIYADINESIAPMARLPTQLEAYNEQYSVRNWLCIGYIKILMLDILLQNGKFPVTRVDMITNATCAPISILSPPKYLQTDCLCIVNEEELWRNMNGMNVKQLDSRWTIFLFTTQQHDTHDIALTCNLGWPWYTPTSLLSGLKRRATIVVTPRSFRVTINASYF